MRHLAAALGALLLGAAACAPADGGESPAPPTEVGSASLEATPGEGEFLNPVITGNFADPHVIEFDGVYYAYATGDLIDNIQVARSEDLVEWEKLDDALPRLPFWQPSSRGLTWAPEVAETSAGYVMYYTARLVAEGRQCLAVAVADDPAGPFVDESEGPFLCQVELGGSIDPHHYVDTDGTPYLLWKNDGNCCGLPTEMWAQELSEDGLSLVGEPVNLGISNDSTWEGRLIEAPTVLLHEGTYYLFFSANDYNSAFYAVGYATADNLLGPYQDARENPILETDGRAAGPGGQSIVEGPDGELWFAYHAWGIDRIGDHVGGRRAMWIDRLVFEEGRPVVLGPTDEPQPAP